MSQDKYLERKLAERDPHGIGCGFLTIWVVSLIVVGLFIWCLLH